MKKAILLIPFLIGCAHKKPEPGLTPSFIEKKGIIYENRMESTPFIFNNELYSMISAREFGKVEIYKDQNLIIAIPSDLKLASAFVFNGRVYVFGTIENKNIAFISSNDLLNWDSPVEIFNAPPGMTVFNTSVAADNNGFIMAYETCEQATTCFNARFLKSTDLLTWTETGSIFHPEKYAACPTIRFIDGMYYVFYLAQVGDFFATYLERSSDLTNWQASPQVVLSTRDDQSEGTNASDMDLIEFNGKLILNYADGDQLTWANIRRAEYDGSLKNFVEEFFK